MTRKLFTLLPPLFTSRALLSSLFTKLLLFTLLPPFFTNILLFTLLSSLFTITIGCSTTRTVTQMVEHVSVDTVYLTNQQYDSIYVHDSSTANYHIGTIDTLYLSRIGANLRVDTIYRERIKTDYKYKLLRDTIYQVRCDSIPVIKEVEIVKIEKYIPPWIKTLAWIGGIAILLIILFVILKLTFR